VSGWLNHRHLRKIDRLMARTACLVCLINTVKAAAEKNNCSASSGHISNPSNLFSLDIYGLNIQIGLMQHSSVTSLNKEAVNASFKTSSASP
jgi:hypothetical protein